MLKAILSKKELSELPEYYGCIDDILRDDEVNSLKEFRHHIGTTRFQHSLNVSYYNFLLCRKFHLNARAAARGGLLHDFFLYDRLEHISDASHAEEHPRVALENASRKFELSELEQDMIVNHMWPVTKTRPHFRETFAITLVDKFCAAAEFSDMVVKYAKSKAQLAACVTVIMCMRLTLK